MMTLSSPPQSHDPSHRIACSLNRRRGGLPLLGDLLRMRGDHLGLLAECAATGADIVEVDLASRSAFVLCNPSVAREVLIEDNDAFVRAGNLETASIRAFLGRGVLTSDGDAWLAYKRMNAPAFARGAVEGMQALVDDSIERSLATWATRGGERPLFDDFLRLAVTATTAGFLSVRPAEDEQDALAAAMLSGPELLFAMARNRAPWLRHLPLPAPRRVRRAIVAVEALLRRNVERRRAAGPADRADLLDLVLQYRHPRTGAPLPDAEVRDQLMTAVIAAPENIATTLSWAAYELAMNADVLARLRASLARGEREWLRAVVDETMRRHAATPMIDRTAARDVEIGGVRVPRGSLVVVPILALHNDPRWWSAPASFRPERFLAGEPPRAFLPFGHGPRKCIGERLARTVVESTLRRFVTRFAWARPHAEPPGVTALVNLRPRDHMRMRVACAHDPAGVR